MLISKQVTTKVPVRLIAITWGAPLSDSSLTIMDCLACEKKLGSRPYAIGTIEEEGEKKSLRLCEDCGKAAVKELQKTSC